MALVRHEPESQSTRTAGIDLEWLAQKIEYRRFQECVHCGLCTASCPTYLETGNENDSPRGRIYLMRSVTDGRLAMSERVSTHLERCLDCRACETACPSGVQYARLIEPFKVALHTSRSTPGPSLLQRVILHHLFPHASRVRLALAPARFMQRLGLISAFDRLGLTRWMPPTLQRLQAMLPKLASRRESLPEVLPAIGMRRARVGLFLGCVADAMFPETTRATARVLQHNGCEVVIPRSQVCCGAIHYHSGQEAPAWEMARQNIRAFDDLDLDAIIVNAAGCGAMLKEYGHLLPSEDEGDARRFAGKVRDICEFLMELGPVPPTHEVPLSVTYHDPCHLCHAQKVRAQPRALLNLIPGLTLRPLAESEICCGAAGTYNLTQPEMADKLGKRKAAHVVATNAEVLATGNIGCILQIARSLREQGSSVTVVHPVDLLHRAYEDPAIPSKVDAVEVAR